MKSTSETSYPEIRITDPPFERTSCGCTSCVACCKRQPGALVTGDFERIVAFTGKTQNLSPEIAFERVKAQIWASEGSVVKDLRSNIMRRIGSITPRWDRRRKCCVFLTDDDKCSIHPVSPFGCAYYDTHMMDIEAEQRSLWAVRQHESAEYQELRDTLPLATYCKPWRRQ
jgi:Fe-S-cluster containining protein